MTTLDSGQEKYFYTFVSIYSNYKYPYTTLQEQGGHITAKIKFPVFSLSFPCAR